MQSCLFIPFKSLVFDQPILSYCAFIELFVAAHHKHVFLLGDGFSYVTLYITEAQMRFTKLCAQYKRSKELFLFLLLKI